MLVVAHPDAEIACERVEPLDQRGFRLAGFGALAELGHQGGEGVLGRRPGCWQVLLHRSKQTMLAPAVFLDETVPASHSAHSFRMLEAYRAAGIPWPTVAFCPILQPPRILEGARSLREAGVSGPRTGSKGRSICLPRGAYRGRSLTWQCPTRSTRRICFFCHTTAKGGNLPLRSHGR